jgi:hypothetical protein
MVLRLSEHPEIHDHVCVDVALEVRGTHLFFFSEAGSRVEFQQAHDRDPIT